NSVSGIRGEFLQQLLDFRARGVVVRIFQHDGRRAALYPGTRFPAQDFRSRPGRGCRVYIHKLGGDECLQQMQVMIDTSEAVIGDDADRRIGVSYMHSVFESPYHAVKLFERVVRFLAEWPGIVLEMVESRQMDRHEIGLVFSENGGRVTSTLTIAFERPVQIGKIGTQFRFEMREQARSGERVDQLEIIGRGGTPILWNQVSDSGSGNGYGPAQAGYPEPRMRRGLKESGNANILAIPIP